MEICEKCMEEKPCEFYDVYQPHTQKTERHYLCSECRNKIVIDWFVVVKTGSW